MSSAVFDTVSLDLWAGGPGEANHQFRATGSVLVKPGFMTVYREGTDDGSSQKRSRPQATLDRDDRILPPLKVGDRLELRKLLSEQHFTEPPPRFSEATLVRALEEYGIGRPSTYAAILSTLRDREYVAMESRRFVPTEMGKVVNRFLTQHFTNYVDYEFTARMEDRLDAVSRGERKWTPLLGEFWQPFRKRVEQIDSSVTRAQAVPPRPLGTDPKSGRPVFARFGRYGPMVQIGDAGDDAKPEFASLLPGQEIDRITLEEALKLFTQMRQLGTDPASGRPVFASRGRYARSFSLAPAAKSPSPPTPACFRARKLTKSPLKRRCNCCSCRETSAKPSPASQCPPVSGGSGRMCVTARLT